MANILSGKTISAELTEIQKQQVEELKKRGIQPGLAVVLAGENPASQIYVRNKIRACEQTGIYSKSIRLPESVSQEELLKVIDELNQDDKIHGILVQLPLPKGIDEHTVIMRISPNKDVDGFHILNAGKLFTGLKGFVPCTPKGIMYMLESAKIDLDGKHAVIVGRSNIVGKPIAMLLLNANCTVTICHSHTKNLAEITKQADVLVAAIGKPKFITADMVKEGACVVDVGINRVDGKVVGDVDFEPVYQKASYITPVPGGVGKMTISMLMQNTIEAAQI
ncbi:MAG: bifunctional methylenetetrahydrofolate dehydrogenase/methenyltetrahydrofolate cyclohydrolase FolD [Eubacteriales bacterium]|nr:bifunctional methylenetetrahydrofolate dehydrogenase/methenyltetrahydrofolate cyclohydrolase FolD [Eubacteriales bacterium]